LPGGSGFRFQVSGFRFQGSGFRVQVSGFRVQRIALRAWRKAFRHTTPNSQLATRNSQPHTLSYFLIPVFPAPGTQLPDPSFKASQLPSLLAIQTDPRLIRASAFAPSSFGATGDSESKIQAGLTKSIFSTYRLIRTQRLFLQVIPC
jgi:hypothetical protein